MSENLLLELYKQHRAGQVKHAYFLLAVAASAVGLAVQKTTGVGLHCSQLPLAVATGLWGTSFVLGCLHVLWSQAAMYKDSELIKLQNADQPVDPLKEATLRSAMAKNYDDAASFGLWQFLLLLSGAVFFIVWHVLEMFLLT